MLPVVATDDLREVLHHARMRPDRWPTHLLSALFKELNFRDATLFSIQEILDGNVLQPVAPHVPGATRARMAYPQYVST